MFPSSHLGDSGSTLVPYGISADGSAVWIDQSDGTVYDSSGNVMTNLANVDSSPAGQAVAMTITSYSPSPLINFGTQFGSGAAAGASTSSRQQSPQGVTGWLQQPSGILSLSNGAVIGWTALGTLVIGMLGRTGGKRR